jgi:hypothetical protein
MLKILHPVSTVSSGMFRTRTVSSGFTHILFCFLPSFSSIPPDGLVYHNALQHQSDVALFLAQQQPV